MNKAIILSTVFAAMLSFNAFARTPSIDDATTSEATKMQQELNDSMHKMHAGMAKSTNIKNPDVAFANGMMAHHMGAIDMANIELKYGKDPEMRKLATAIVKAQETEIKQMKKWLEKTNTF